MLKGMGAALAAAGTATTAHAAHDHAAHDQENHHHDGNKNDALTDATSHCISRGEICLDHCHDNLEAGEKAMAACARSVNEMLAVCTALLRVSTQNAPSLKQMAAVAAEVCKRCEDECNKHAKKHAERKDCAEICVACGKECKKIAA
jgi:Cys-rich four helix bundle protein (predicted Tat secretion target)